MHIPHHDNKNVAIVGIDDADLPLAYFNIVRLRNGERFTSTVPGYETCLVPAHGTMDVEVEAAGSAGRSFAAIGERGSVWEGDPSAVYVPVGSAAHIRCRSETTEVFIAGARFDQALAPFAVRAADIDPVQYGSDDTKTHRKIKHILGRSRRTAWAAFWSRNCSPWARAAGPAIRRTSTTPTGCRTRRVMTRPTIFASAPTTASACNSCSARTARSATPITCRWLDGGSRRGLPPVCRGSRSRDVLLHHTRRPQPAAAGAILPAGTCLSGRNHSRHQGHDREVSLTARRRLREYRPVSRPARKAIRTINCCSAGRSVGG